MSYVQRAAVLRSTLALGYIQGGASVDVDGGGGGSGGRS